MGTSIKHPDAFTLMELLVVIAVITILAGLLVPAIGKARGKTVLSQAQHELTVLAQTELMIESDTGYLVRLEFLDNGKSGGSAGSDDVNNSVIPNEDFQSNSISISSDAWDGPYTNFRSIGSNRRLLDPWGNEYELDAAIVTPPYRIRSLGPDKDDDSWTEYDPATGNGDIIYKFQ